MRSFCIKTALAAVVLFSVLLAAGSGAGVCAESAGDAAEETGGKKDGLCGIVVRVHGDGRVRLTDPHGEEHVLDSGEKRLDIPAHTFIRLDAGAREQTVISVAIRTEDGIELEPESLEETTSYTREITASAVTKVVDVTFGKTPEKRSRASVASMRGSERFPEVGDRFSGVGTVHAVDGGNGHTVHGVTLGSFTGILSGAGSAEVDCSQHGAAAPEEGMKYDYTYTVTSVDKASGTVRGNIFATSQTLAAVGTPGTEGYQRGYQSLSGIFSIHRDYNGRLNLEKSSANTRLTAGNGCYTLAGAKYGVYTDASCTAQTAVLTTGADGVTNTVELPIGKYYIRELAPPPGYALDGRVYTADVAADQTVVVETKDQPQSAAVSILLSKKDSETGENEPQGAAVLSGAEFTVKFYAGFYDGDPAAQGAGPARSWVLRTDADGAARLTDSQKVSGDPFYTNSAGVPVLPLGTVTIQETKPAAGYLINDTVYVRKITSEGSEENVQSYREVQVPEQVIRGDLRLVKFLGDLEEGQDQKTPLEGIIFEITSKTTGETVEIVTDENGYASTEQLGHERGGLAYDTYTVHEKNTPPGLVQVKDFEITVSREGQTLYYILEDKTVVSPVRLVKTDGTSGRTIPAANTKFRLLDEEKNVIRMTTYYPKEEVHEIFETDKDGTFILPEKLPAGDYYFREVQAPHGYLLGRGDVRFTIDTNHNWDAPLEVVFPDLPAMGRIHLTKTDAETGELLAGAEFTVTAAEDVVTPDGTLRLKAGESAAVVTTDERGEAQTEDLFLGKYVVTESRQPPGYVKCDGSWEVELAYQDQYTAVVLEQLEIENVPTKVVINKKETGAEKRLPGVKFAVWDQALGADSEELFVTGSDGTITLERLLPGTYCVREVETIPGYVKEDTVFEFTVDEDGRIAGEETGRVLVENDATRITKTSVHNAATNTRQAEPGLVEAVDTVSMENLCPGVTYRLKGILVDQRTGEPLRESKDGKSAVLMSETEFMADAASMDVDVRFEFDASELEGWTISVFEYLYQDGVEISSHTDLEDVRQQLHITMPENENVKPVPKTGDDAEIPVAAVAALLLGSAASALCIAIKRWRRRH